MYPGVLLATAMLFDSPGANHSLMPWIGVAVVGYPVAVVVGLVRVWRAHKRGDGPGAYMALAIPMTGAVIYIALARMVLW